MEYSQSLFHRGASHDRTAAGLFRFFYTFYFYFRMTLRRVSVRKSYKFGLNFRGPCNGFECHCMYFRVGKTAYRHRPVTRGLPE